MPSIQVSPNTDHHHHHHHHHGHHHCLSLPWCYVTGSTRLAFVFKHHIHFGGFCSEERELIQPSVHSNLFQRFCMKYHKRSSAIIPLRLDTIPELTNPCVGPVWRMCSTHCVHTCASFRVLISASSIFFILQVFFPRPAILPMISI